MLSQMLGGSVRTMNFNVVTRYPSIGTVPDCRGDNDRLVEVYLRFLVRGATASSGVVAYEGVCAPL